MSKKTKGLTALGAAVAVTALLAGCSASSSTDPSGSAESLVYIIPSSWANFGGFQENIDAFTKKTGIDVEVQGIPDEQYDQSLRARLASGDGVDIFSGLNDEKDPSTFMVEITDPTFESRLIPGLKDAMTSADGKLYSIPSAEGVSTFGVFYNKDVFAAAGISDAPKTLDDLTKAFESVKATGVTPLFLAGKDGWTLLQHRNAVNANFLQGNPKLGKELASNKAAWSDIPGFDAQYDALRGWATSGLTNSDLLTASYEQSLAALANGSAGAIINGSWVIGPIRDDNPDANIGFLALPNPDGDVQIGLNPPALMHIAKSSKHQKAARQLLDFLIEPAQAENFLASNPGIPSYKDVSVAHPDPVLTDIQKYVDAGQTGAAFDATVRFPTPQDDIIAAYQELVAGRIDVAEFAKRYDAAWVAAGKTAGRDGF
jgi:raffinose/stachyose/melibiose transport system substrate-binding protein